LLLLAASLAAAVSLNDPAHAFDSAGLTLASIEGEGWSVQQVQLRFSWLDATHLRLQLHAQAAQLPEPLGKLTGLQLECPQATFVREQFDCPRGSLHVDAGHWGRQRARIAFSYRPGDSQLKLQLQDILLAGGRVALSGQYDRSGWQLNADARGLGLEAAADRLVSVGLLQAGITGTGAIDLDAALQGKGAQLLGARITASLAASEFSDEAGGLAGENLGLQLEVAAAPGPSGWQMEFDLTGQRGRVYIDPVFVEIPPQQLHASARVDWQPATSRLVVHAFEYDHPGTVRLRADGVLGIGAAAGIESLTVDVHQGVFPGLYTSYLQPWLRATPLGDLRTSGELAGQLQWQAGSLSKASVRLRDVLADDNEGRFGLEQVQGQLDWMPAGGMQKSALSWGSGRVFNIALGPAQLAVESDGPQLRLLEPVTIPVLDGELHIDRFSLDAPGSKPLRWDVDGILTPVSMRQLTQALGWPEFSGKLSGVIPDVRYSEGNLKVGGVLLVRVFDGDITLRNLSMAHPLGVIPRLWVDAGAHNIDLETLTRTFSFGKIEGRLNGRVDGLYMESWRPVAFDAQFATPEGDSSRHRISQKAVDNISSIGGGGMGGALSRSFLRFFKEFPYDRLGLSCRLENGVCAMGGVAPAPNGYYIVKSRLLPPRLDVIGYADRVDWGSLMAQLKAATRGQAPVVH